MLTEVQGVAVGRGTEGTGTSQKTQTYGYKISKYQGCNVQMRTGAHPAVL